MKRFALTICLAACLVFVCGATAMAVNSVTVESKTVAPNAVGQVANVWVVNDVSLTGFVIPLELRSEDPGAFTVGPSSQFKFRVVVPVLPNLGNRIGSSPLMGSVTENKYAVIETDPGLACSGPTASTYSTPATPNFVSPDAVMDALVSQAAPPKLYYLPAGSDYVAGTFTDWPDEGETTDYNAGGSFNFLFNVTGVEGYFDIDTCCVTPANHLSGTDLNVSMVPFEFTMGRIRIYTPPNQCPINVIATPSPVSATVGVVATSTITASDPENNLPISFYKVSGPGTVTLGGVWSYDAPKCTDMPYFDVVVNAVDAAHTQGQCDQSVVTFRVNVEATDLAFTCAPAVSVNWKLVDPVTKTLSASGGCPDYTYTLVSGKGAVDGNVWSFTPTCQDIGPATVVTLLVTDESVPPQTLECSFNLTVTNAAPVCAVIPSKLSPTGVEVTVDVSATGDTDPLTYTLIGAVPAWNETIVGNTYKGTRPAGDVALHTVHYTVSDGCGPAIDCYFSLTFERPCIKIVGADTLDPACNLVKYSMTLSGRNKSLYVMADVDAVPGNLAGGFDLLICYDASGLSFLNASQPDDVTVTDGYGDECPPLLMTGLPWEYFTYRTGLFGGNCGGGCPNGYIKLVSIAEMNNGVQLEYPADFNVVGTVWAVLNFYVTADRNYINSCFHVGFCSYECGDNSVSSVTGDTLWLPDRAGNDVGFDPNYPTACPRTDKQVRPEVLVFCGGRICVVPPPDDRGDINLNGIANEIGDAVLLTNFFIYGSSVWDDTYEEAQILASDINNDGLPATVADLIYLIRIITGDAQPFPGDLNGGSPKLSPYANSVNVVSNVSNGALNVRTSSNVELGGALLVYRYSGVSVGTPTAAPGFEIKSRASDGELRMVVYGAKVSAGSNTLVTVPVTGDGAIELVESQFSDYNGALLSVNAAKVGPPKEYALLQNYPNPFNAGTVIPIVLKDASEWSLSIYNVAGQVVRTFSGSSDAGTVNVAWDGRAADGSTVASGMYFYRATTPNFTATKKMVLLK